MPGRATEDFEALAKFVHDLIELEDAVARQQPETVRVEQRPSETLRSIEAAGAAINTSCDPSRRQTPLPLSDAGRYCVVNRPTPRRS